MEKITQQSRLNIRWLNTKLLTLLLFGVFLSILKGQAQTFSYTGAVQTVTLAAGSYEIEMWGGNGGNNLAADTGGKGGYSKGILNVTATTTYYIYVGGKGLTGLGAQPSAVGGFNGGGTAGAFTSTGYGMGSGGGASHVATATGLLSALSGNQQAVIIVAGGGGGAGSNNGGSTLLNNGGHGGGLSGDNGKTNTTYGGTGGTQTAGGTGTGGNGSFGQGGNNSGSNTGGGGGGGWYGGGAAQWEGSGGGSSYMGGLNAGVTAIFGQTGFMPNPDTSGNGTVVITSMAPCTGAPTVGVASATSRLCSSQPFTLSVTTATKAGGITYQWERSNAGTGVWSPIPTATTSSFQVTNQTVASDYRFVITCTNSNSTVMSNVVSVAQAVAGVFYENFDSTPPGTSSNASVPTCWSYLDSHSGYGYTYSTAGRTGNGFYVYIPVSTGNLMLISPTTDNLGNGTKQVRFWARVSTVDYQATQKLGIYTMNGTTATATKTLVEDQIPLTTAWQEFIVPLPATTDDNFAFNFDSKNALAYVYIDDVYYEDLSPCLAPMGIALSNITGTTADISWKASVASGVTGYSYEVRDAAGKVVSSGNTTGTTAQATGLTAGKDYTVYVRSICGASNGDWTTLPRSFTTLCTVVTSNFYEDFNAAKTGSSANPTVPNCWTYLKTATSSSVYGFTSTTAARTGLGFQTYRAGKSGTTNDGDLLLISPETVDLGAGTKQIRFSAKTQYSGPSYGGKINIYTMNGKTATATRKLIAIINVPTTGTWQEFIVPLPITTDDYFAFSFEQENITKYLFIDDVYYEDLSACMYPASIGAINITATSATINWSKSLAPGVTGYEYEVRSSGAPGSGPIGLAGSGSFTSANTVSANVSSLAPGTTSKVYVRSKCGTTTGAWTISPGEFTTLCAAITGNFYQDFESTPQGNSNVPTVPPCWTYLKTGTSTSLYGYTYYIAANKGIQGFYTYRPGASGTTYNGDIMLISPETADLGNGDKRIRFSARRYFSGTTSYTGKLEIYTMNGTTATATKTLIATIDVAPTAAWDEYIVYLPKTTDDYFAFSFPQENLTKYIFIDDVYYEDIPPLVATATKVDILCNGANSGTAVVKHEGGKPPYTYAWTPSGQTTSAVSNLVPGVHNVTVTDARGKTAKASVTITEPTVIVPNLTFTNVSCNGKNDGSAIVAPSGGVGPYTVLWSDGKIGTTNTKLAPGNYSVTVRDANSCPIVVDFVVTEPNVLASVVSNQTNVSVYGGNDGAATITVTGGTAPYTYKWSPSGGNTASATNLMAGIYTVLITDANGCTVTQTVKITQPAIPYKIDLVSQKNVSCNGKNDGSISVNVTGGTAPYTYTWSNNSSNGPTIDNLAPGVYDLTVTDVFNDKVTASYTITEPAVLAVNLGNVININCNGSNTGGATATVTGGTAPYTYLWSNGMVTATVTNLVAGNHSVKVTDSNGCTVSQSVSITEPAALVATKVNTTDISCFGQNNGSATVSVAGGVAPYTYSWSNNQTGPTISNLSKGTYMVTITDANNCTITETFTIVEPAFVHPPVIPSQGFCVGQNAKLSDVVITGSNIKWFSAATGGNLLPNSTVLVNGTTYYASQTVNGCESTTRTSIQVSIYPVTPLTATQVNICGSSLIQDVSIQGLNHMQLKWYSSASSVTPLSSTYLLVAGTYYVSTVNNTCESARQAIQVTVSSSVPVPVVTPQYICGSGTVADFKVTPIAGATLNWYISMQSVTPLASNTAVLSGTYYVEQVVGSCKSVRVPVPVQIVSTMSPSITSVVVCDGTTIADFNNTSSPTKYVWFVDNVTTTPLNDTYVIKSGTYFIAQEISGCVSQRKSVGVIANARPVSPTGNLTQTFSFDANVSDLLMNQPNVAWYLTYDDAMLQVNELTAKAKLVNDQTYYAILRNANCGSYPTAVLVKITVGTQELDLANLKYFPNPIESELNISYPESIRKVEVFTITGQKTVSKDFDSREVKIDLSSLSSGTYVVRIVTDNAAQFVKVVKK